MKKLAPANLSFDHTQHCCAGEVAALRQHRGRDFLFGHFGPYGDV